MNKKQTKEGKCLICGTLGKLTFEHVPPQSAFNKGPIYMQDYDRMLNKESFLYGKKIRMNQGFGSYTLCASCNNNTGNWYAQDFIKLAQFGMRSMIFWNKIGGRFVWLRCYVSPLNVLKQILAMFMSADKGGILSRRSELAEFILDRHSKNMPSNYKAYMYSTMSSMKRMLGASIVYDPRFGVCKWSEINYQPFGYVLTDSSVPPENDMFDITYFSRFEFDKEVDIIMRLPYLIVESPFIGQYG